MPHTLCSDARSARQGKGLQTHIPSLSLKDSLGSGVRTRREGSTIWTSEKSLFLWCLRMPFLEKAVAPHSSTLAWKIPWMEEPGGPPSMGSLRVGQDSATSLSLFTFLHWRRQWQPTPVFLPGESQGRGSLVGCRLWGRTESDTTEAT